MVTTFVDRAKIPAKGGCTFRKRNGGQVGAELATNGPTLRGRDLVRHAFRVPGRTFEEKAGETTATRFTPLPLRIEQPAQPKVTGRPPRISFFNVWTN